MFAIFYAACLIDERSKDPGEESSAAIMTVMISGTISSASIFALDTPRVDADFDNGLIMDISTIFMGA